MSIGWCFICIYMYRGPTGATSLAVSSGGTTMRLPNDEAWRVVRDTRCMSCTHPPSDHPITIQTSSRLPYSPTTSIYRDHLATRSHVLIFIQVHDRPHPCRARRVTVHPDARSDGDVLVSREEDEQGVAAAEQPG